MIRAVRRNTELGLLVLAAIIVTSTYALASLARTASLPADVGPFLGIILALFAGAHVAIRRLAPLSDGLLLPLAGLLNGIGYVFIARIDTNLAGLQANWTFFGIAAFIGTLLVVQRIRDLELYRYLCAAAGIGLLLLPLVPGLGREVNGARIWVRIGPVNFQPGEFAKILLAIFIASFLVERRELIAVGRWKIGSVTIPGPRDLGPVVLAFGASMIVMVAERDLGSSLLLMAVFVVMLWVATGKPMFLAAGAAMFGLGATIAYQIFSHVERRVAIWLDPWQDATGDGFQVVQATFALAWGGVGGTGPGLGDSVGRIPALETDFIFAIVGEELGLLGATAILAAYLLMVGSGLRIALRADDDFEKLLATGLTATLGIQTFIIIGGVIRVVPLTGITLPFMSYGGSSLLANYVLLALLVRISHDQTRRSIDRAEREATRATELAGRPT